LYIPVLCHAPTMPHSCSRWPPAPASMATRHSSIASSTHKAVVLCHAPAVPQSCSRCPIAVAHIPNGHTLQLTLLMLLPLRTC
jgi:hypothetical protein